MAVSTRKKRRIIMESDEEDEEEQYTKDEQHVIEIDSDVEEEEAPKQKDAASVWDFPTSPPPPPAPSRYPRRKRVSRYAKLTEEKEKRDADEEEDSVNHPAVINELFQSDDVLIYPYSGKNAVSLRKRDLQRLEEDELLNDALIDIYPKILEETHPEANIHTFSSLFYTRLISKSRTKKGGRITIDHDSVKRWTNNKNLFSKSCLIIPIEQRNHWYLAVVIHPAYCIEKLDEEEEEEEKSIVLDDEEEEEKSTVLDDEEKDKGITLDDEEKEESITLDDEEKEESIILEDEEEEKNGITDNKSEEQNGIKDSKSDNKSKSISKSKKNKNKKDDSDEDNDEERSYIAILDPLGKKHAATYRSLCEYLKEEAMDKLKITEERFVPPVHFQADCPRQNNFSDCGIFCLHFIQQIYQSPELMMYALINQKVEAVTDEHWKKEDIPQLRKVLQLMLLQKFDEYEAYTKDKQD